MNNSAKYEKITKGFRRDIPPHRLCITWLINNKCNYRCTYCLNGFDEPPGFKILTPDEWLDVWEDVYNKYGTASIQITGGEPAVYPNFFEVMNNVGKMHYIELQTNLSWDPRELIDKVPVDCVSRIGGSFHPQYSDFEEFLEKMIVLQKAGFKVEINYVAYPPILKEAESRINKAKEKNVQLSILSFQGEYEGKKYPENYNEEEKEILKKLNISSGESAEAMANWDVEHKKIGVAKEAEVPLRVCRMGQMYTWIKPDGQAMLCCKSPTVLGNIIDKTFKLFDEAQACRLDNCICWRNMTVGEEERWVDRWPGTKDKAKD